jgi:hypothetical protein
MPLIYRHFFVVGDRIHCVSKARRTMWEPRGIRHDLGRCDRQRVREHFSFAAPRRKCESLEKAARGRRARGMRPGIRSNAGFLAAAGRLCSAVVVCCHPGPPADHAGVRGPPPGVAGRRNRVEPPSLVPATVSIPFPAARRSRNPPKAGRQHVRKSLRSWGARASVAFRADATRGVETI